MPTIRKVIGNPGTGKTKYLVDHTAGLIQSGIKPDEIAYLAFTKKAAQEAIERLCAVTGHTQAEFKWVRTLHSMAFTTLGIKRDQMLSEADYLFFLNSAGVTDQQEARQLQQMHSLSRIADIPLMDAWRRLQGSFPVPWTSLLEYDRIYKLTKSNLGKYDFGDLLENYLKNPLVPRLHTVIVDEGQDISSIQWDMIALISKKAQHLIIAGDPHQAIYQWCGADSSLMTALDGEEVILPKSNRIPAPVQRASRKVLAKFANPDRYPYEPASHPGMVKNMHRLNMHAFDLTKGTWMFLSRNEVFLNDVRSFLFESGIAFESKGEWAKFTTDAKMLRLIEWYNAWLDTGEITPGKQEKLKAVCTNVEYCVVKNKPWFDAFDAIPARDRRFLRSMLNGDANRITLSTIHGSKGGEADNVVLLGDFTRAVDEGFMKHSAAEWATLYVGMTRAKRNLYLIDPARRLGYNWRNLL